MKKNNIIVGVALIVLIVFAVMVFILYDQPIASPTKPIPGLDMSQHPGSFITLYPGEISDGEVTKWILEEKYEKLDFLFEDQYGRFFDYKEKIKNNLFEVKELLTNSDFEVFFLVSDPTKFCRKVVKNITVSEYSKELENYFSSTNENEINITEIGTLIHPYQILDKKAHFPISRLFKGTDKKYYYLMK